MLGYFLISDRNNMLVYLFMSYNGIRYAPYNIIIHYNTLIYLLLANNGRLIRYTSYNILYSLYIHGNITVYLDVLQGLRRYSYWRVLLN